MTFKLHFINKKKVEHVQNNNRVQKKEQKTIPFLLDRCPTSGGVVLRSKLVDGKGQAQSPIALVDIDVRHSNSK